MTLGFYGNVSGSRQGGWSYAMHACSFFLLCLLLLPVAVPVFAEPADTLIDDGKAHYELKEYDEALQSFSSAVERDPRNPKAHYHRAKALFKLEKYSEALEGFDRAISLRKDYRKAYYRRGKTHYELDRFREAVADYSKAIELKDGYAKAYYRRGLARLALKDTAQAVADIRKAASLGNKKAAVWLDNS